MSSRGPEMDLINDPKNSRPAGIYLHIPFCRQKCLYCDFVSRTDLSLVDDYVNALCGEISLRQNRRSVVDSIYLGGGTPTLLTPDQVDRIITVVRHSFDVAEDVEITIEANPETVTLEALKQFVAMRVNRISIGIQSFQPKLLQLLGRSHDEKTAHSALDMARAAGFAQIGLDLIFGIPGQTVALLTDDLQTAIKHAPHHLSCYSLTIAPSTPFQKLCDQKVITPVADSQIALFFEKTDTFLTDRGYEHYEISNFAKPGCRSRHNQKYWQGIPYWGFGVAAHSYLPPVRSWNDSSLRRYIATIGKNRLPTVGSETLTTKEQTVEIIMLGLRTDQGVELAFLDGLHWRENSRAKTRLIQEWLNEGKARIHKNRLILTVDGMLVADGLTGNLLDLLN